MSSLLLLIVRLPLAGVLGAAGLMKLRDLSESRAAVVRFGVPDGIGSPLGVLLPFVELATAVALLRMSSARWAAVVAFALLLAFSTAVAVNLARGRRPDCNCFGAVQSAPIGPRTLARNAVLLAAAVLVAMAGPGRSAFAWLGRMSAADLGLTLAVACLAVGLIAVGTFAITLFRQHGRLLLRLEALEAGAPGPAGSADPGLPIGAAAPEFALRGLDGETMTLSALRSHEQPVLLLFTDPECGPCDALLPDVGEWQRRHASLLTTALMSRRSVDANRPKTREHGIVNVFVQEDNEVAEAYAVTATPAAVLVAADGSIVSPAALGADSIRMLVQSVADRPPGTGDEAPNFELPTLDGPPVRLADYRGRRVLLLSWNASCSFCAAMADDVRRFEAEPERAELLLLAAGDAGANREFAFVSPVALDRDSVVATRYGIRGTPMAVLVTGDGTIATEPATGADQVLALARDTRGIASPQQG